MKMNNKKIYLVALTTTALLSSCAHKGTNDVAREPNSMRSFCKSFSKIQEESEACDDNDKFVDAAEACLVKFEKGMKAAGIKIHTPDDARMFDREGGMDPSQEPSTTSSENVTETWIKNGNQAVQDLKSYTEQLNYPEDAEDEDEHGSDPEQYANTVACYGESKKSITDVADDFQYYLEQLIDLKKSQ